MTILPLTTPLLRNFSNFGEGVTEVLALFDEGSSAGLGTGPCLEVAFLLRTGREVGVCLERGLLSVDACSLSRIGDSCGTAGVSGFFMGERSSMRTQFPQSPEVPILWSCSSLQTLEQLNGEACGLVGMVVWWRVGAKRERFGTAGPSTSGPRVDSSAQPRSSPFSSLVQN